MRHVGSRWAFAIRTQSPTMRPPARNSDWATQHALSAFVAAIPLSAITIAADREDCVTRRIVTGANPLPLDGLVDRCRYCTDHTRAVRRLN